MQNRAELAVLVLPTPGPQTAPRAVCRREGHQPPHWLGSYHVLEQGAGTEDWKGRCRRLSERVPPAKARFL